MEIKKIKVKDIVESISVTHNFKTEKLYAVNTSDVLNGDFLTPELHPVNELKGQFKKTIKNKDILFSEIRPANRRFARVELDDTSKYVVSTKLMVLRKKNKDVNLDYFYYWLTSNETLRNLQSRAENRIGSFPQITFDLLGEYVVPVPDDLIQNKISQVLKSIDYKIKINNKIFKELESIAKTIYDYWFLQFEFPNNEGKPYKSSGGKMLWSEELKRVIPESWEVKNLLENNLCSDIKVGVDNFTLKNYLSTAQINIEEITDGEDITYDNRENRANMQPIKNSVWFAKMKSTIKHLTLTENSDWFIDKYILSTGFQGIKCRQESLSYIHCVVNSNWFENHKDVISHGSTQKGINYEDLKNIMISIPPSRILNEFSKLVYPLLMNKLSIIKENQEISSLRDFLLPLLMNGQVSIKRSK